MGEEQRPSSLTCMFVVNKPEPETFTEPPATNLTSTKMSLNIPQAFVVNGMLFVCLFGLFLGASEGY